MSSIFIQHSGKDSSGPQLIALKRAQTVSFEREVNARNSKAVAAAKNPDQVFFGIC